MWQIALQEQESRSRILTFSQNSEVWYRVRRGESWGSTSDLSLSMNSSQRRYSLYAVKYDCPLYVVCKQKDEPSTRIWLCSIYRTTKWTN